MVSMVALVRVLENAGLLGLVEQDAVPGDAMAARRGLEEREEGILSGERVTKRVGVRDVL